MATVTEGRRRRARWRKLARNGGAEEIPRARPAWAHRRKHAHRIARRLWFYRKANHRGGVELARLRVFDGYWRDEGVLILSLSISLARIWHHEISACWWRLKYGVLFLH